MRIKNKIRIVGDTLQIFEAVTPERREELEQVAREIYNIAGNSDANERLAMMKEMGITDEEEQNEVSVMYNKLWDMEMNENFDDTLNEAKEKKDPAEKKKADKTNYGNKDMSDIDMVNPYELKKGIRIEMVSIDDYEKAMDKAVKKLKKDPMFYSNMIADAKETKGKRADVPTEVKDKKLNKVSDKLKDKANEMEVSKKDATKKNANDSLNKKEKASGKPKGVKEMTMTPKKAKGMKSMDVPGKEKTIKESFNLWESFKKNILR